MTNEPPSAWIEDHEYKPKKVPVRWWRWVSGKLYNAEEERKRWAIELREIADSMPNKGMGIVVPADGSQQAMAVTIHELLHACGVPDRALHKIDEKGRDCTDHVARVMWKLGWRQITAGERDIINGIRSAARGE